MGKGKGRSGGCEEVWGRCGRVYGVSVEGAGKVREETWECGER